MPTLKQIRDWAKGDEVEGLPERVGRWEVEKSRPILPDPFSPVKCDCECVKCSDEEIFSPPKKDCSNCGGKGYTLESSGQVCRNCQGTGEWSGNSCEACLGKGWLRQRVDFKTGKPSQYFSPSNYSISTDGADAMLKFGKHHGKNLSELVINEPGYIRWILDNDFPSELKDVCLHVWKNSIKLIKRAKKKDL